MKTYASLVSVFALCCSSTTFAITQDDEEVIELPPVVVEASPIGGGGTGGAGGGGGGGHGRSMDATEPTGEPVQVAAISEKLDVRCADPTNQTTSKADKDARVAAAQRSFDNTFQRNRLADSTWSIIGFGVRMSLGLGDKYRFEMTYADGGTETIQVTNLTGSLNLAAVDNTLKQGSGEQEPKECKSPVGEKPTP
jgi:hypothetical protein